MVVLGAWIAVVQDSRLPNRLSSPYVLAWAISISWLILFSALRMGSLRPIRIEEEDMDLARVSPEFATHLEADRGIVSENRP
jgi:hypothetical protein